MASDYLKVGEEIEQADKWLGRNSHLLTSPQGGDDLKEAHALITALKGEVLRLDALINNPHTEDFLESVRLEAAHQQERWATSHDEGKGHENWYWLVGYLAGKALRSLMTGDTEKGLHHIVTTGAALLNWHARASGLNYKMGVRVPDMQPSDENVVNLVESKDEEHRQ